MTERVAMEFGTNSSLVSPLRRSCSASQDRRLIGSERKISRPRISLFGVGIAQRPGLKQATKEFQDRGVVLWSRRDWRFGKERVERPIVTVPGLRRSPFPCLQNLFLRRRMIKQVPSYRPSIL